MRVKFGEKLGNPTCPYLQRWTLEIYNLFSIRLHRWFRGDDERALHDHPWNFYGIVLKGSYTDLTEEGREEMPTGKVFYRDAEHKHTVETKGCWTLVLTGPVIRKWGFWLRNKSKTADVWFKAKRYFIKHGHHPCS